VVEVFDAPQFRGTLNDVFVASGQARGEKGNRCGSCRRSCEQAAKDLHKEGSMGIALSNDAKQLVDHLNFAHLATIIEVTKARYSKQPFEHMPLEMA
jgi:hypothetical protein